MPLPDADDPKTSNVYAQLRSSTLGDVTQDAFDKVRDPVHINAAFEDEARRLKLYGELSGKSSSSGAMPGTFNIIEVEVVAATTYSVFTVPEGESWRIVAAGTEAFFTNQSYIIAKLKDGSNGKSVRIDALSSGFAEFTLNEPIDITYPCEVLIQAGASGTPSGTNLNQFAFVRMR